MKCLVSSLLLAVPVLSQDGKCVRQIALIGSNLSSYAPFKGRKDRPSDTPSDSFSGSLILLLSLSFLTVLTHDHTSMSPRELLAFEDVAHACREDVRNYCDDPFLSLDPRPALLMSHSEDEFANMMDHLLLTTIQGMMASASLHDEVHSQSGSFLLVLDLSDEGEDVGPQQWPKVDAAAEHVVTHVASQTDPSDMEAVSVKVQEHGHKVLQQEESSAVQRRMARRLTEVDADLMMEQRTHYFLPFGCPRRNRCLHDLFVNNVVDAQCSLAMKRLEHVRAVQHMQWVQRHQEQEFVVQNLFVLYAIVLATIVIVFIRRGSEVRQNRHKKLRILKAIYSRPALKAAVEDELGESLGHVPPLRWRALMKFGLYSRDFQRLNRIGRWVHCFMICILAVLLFVAPIIVLPVCISMASLVFWVAACTAPPTPMCTCCCCGVSTEDVKEGLVTEQQACCSCCQGTGVCSVRCASCCGTGGSKKKDPAPIEGCCCCGDGCCCCGGGRTSPVKVGGCCCDGNGCCCCGGGDKRSADKMESCCGDGCCCCGGDNAREMAGCCDDGCCCCKTDGSTTRKKRVRLEESPVSIYEGVPIQIV